MLSPYRSIGLFSTHVPHQIRYQATQKVPIVVCPIGNVFISYYVDRLRSVHVSDPTPNAQPITQIATDKNFVYTACGTSIYKYSNYQKIVADFQDNGSSFKQILPFGDYLISVNTNDEIIIFDIVQESVHSRIPARENFSVTCITHPLTFLNKVIVGSNEGRLTLVNIKSGREIHEFQSIKPKNGEFQSITCLEQTPAKGVIAVCYSTGIINFLNINTDELIFSLSHETAVTSISFRTDGVEQLAVGLKTGKIAIWDLENQKLVGEKEAHRSEIAGLNYIHNQGIMVSNGSDNSIVLWTFDTSSEVLTLPVQRVSRKGHQKEVSTVMFYSEDYFLTSGKDSLLNSWSLERVNNAVSFGRAKSCTSKQFKKLKSKNERESATLPPINHLAIELARQSDWSCITTSHRNKLALWNLEFKRQENTLTFHSEITSTYISKCGNFVLTGFADGRAQVTNMQSAQNRAAWVAFEGLEVRFIYVDVFLERIVTVAGDRVRIWKWYNAKNGMTGGTGNIGLVKMIEEIELEAFIDTAGGKTLVNSEGFVLSLDNFTLVLIAKNSEKNWVVARKFRTISPIVDFCISSPDGRFLIASNTDKEITTWDIITGQKIDIFRLPMITTSISCAKDGRFIGMTHVGQKGVSIWVNLNILEQQKFKVWTDEKMAPLKSLPGLSYDAENEVDEEEDFSDSDENSDYESDSDSEFGEVSLKFGENSQLTNKQITLSNIPENKWSALPKLDLLKLKNKAINPKKKAALAPFFLETKKMGGGDKNTDDFEFVKSAGGDDDTLDLTQKLTQNSEFLNALESDTFQDLFDLFEKYSASRIDRELRSLVIEEVGNVKASTENMEEVEETRNTGALRLEQYLSQILGKLRSRMDYEVCNAYLAVFLNVHEDWMLECGSDDNEINEVLSQILDVLDEDVDKLSYQFDQSLTILQWLKHSIV